MQCNSHTRCSESDNIIKSEKKTWQMLHYAECNTFWVEVDQLFSPLQGFSFRSAAASACVTTVRDDAVVVVVQSLLFIVLPL